MGNLGLPVTTARLDAGEAALKEMLPDAGPEVRLGIVIAFKNRIERDQPAALLGADPKGDVGLLDVTGRYRLLASMLATL